jgi:hypothetical protein
MAGSSRQSRRDRRDRNRNYDPGYAGVYAPSVPPRTWGPNVGRRGGY